MLAVLYRFGPALKKPAWRWVTPGSAFAVVFLIISTFAFAYYAAHFGSYNKTYGSLGAAIRVDDVALDFVDRRPSRSGNQRRSRARSERRRAS